MPAVLYLKLAYIIFCPEGIFYFFAKTNLNTGYIILII